jgi:hypothetical protein
VIEIPTDLPADLAPLSWLLGVWEGTGVIDYTARGEHFAGEFAHRVSFSHDGGDALNYSASAWLIDGETRTALVSEVGFWRLVRPAGAADPGPGLLPGIGAAPTRTADDVEALRTAEGGFELEAAIVHSDGVSELYLGQIRGPRIDLATDAVVRSASAKEYTAATRMYGLVDNHLLWAWDIAALGAELASHASARLAKAP